MKRNKSGKSPERNLSKAAPIERLSEDWWASRPPEVRERRCTARRTDGSNDRCKNPALTMQRVCRYHGGAAKHAKEAANRRLGEALDRMARNLLGIADSAESDAVRLQAIKHVLALGGITEKQALDVSVEIPPYERILQRINFGESREEAARRRGDTRTLEAIGAEIVDAEVVDDDTDDDEEPPQRPARRWKPPAADTDRSDDASAAYRASAPAVTGMAAISAAADASRAAGRQSRRRR